MRRWLILSLGIVILMVVGAIYVVRALFPPPTPEPPMLADAPADFHINEIDLALSGAVLISIDNRTSETLTIDLAALGKAVADGLRLFDLLDNEWTWIDVEGRGTRPLLDATVLQTGMGWNTESNLKIEPGRSESAMLAVNPGLNLAAMNWIARMRSKPDRLVYVLDFQLPIRDPQTGGRTTVRLTAKGETAYLPRP